MLSELQKIIQTDNLNHKTTAKLSPMLLQAVSFQIRAGCLSLYYINLVGKAEKQ